MPLIQNVSLEDIQSGDHFYTGNEVLIQIVDPCMEFPIPKGRFIEIHQFEICDVARPLEILWECRMSDIMGEQLVDILRRSFEMNYNIIVHCVKGLSRSGAVVEVGLKLGFTDLSRPRFPNNYMIRVMSHFV